MLDFVRDYKVDLCLNMLIKYSKYVKLFDL